MEPGWTKRKAVMFGLSMGAALVVLWAMLVLIPSLRHAP